MKFLQQAVASPAEIRLLAKMVERNYAPRRPIFTQYTRDTDAEAIEHRTINLDLSDVLEDYANLLESQP